MQQDFDAHVYDQMTLHTSVSDLDALARHVICACDLIEASRQTQPILAQVEAALNILKRVLAYAALQDTSAGGLQVMEEVADKVKLAEARRAALPAVDEAGSQTAEMDAGTTHSDEAMDAPASAADLSSSRSDPTSSPAQATTANASVGIQSSHEFVSDTL